MVLKFVQFKSFVDQTFWFKLAEIKLEIDRLNECEKEIQGFWTDSNSTGNFLQVDYTAFNELNTIPRNYYKAKGVLINKNTIESFKNVDKKSLIEEHGNRILKLMDNDTKDLSYLSYFILLTFADLKKYRFYYWFAFPTPVQFIIEEYTTPKNLIEHWSKEKLHNLHQIYLSNLSQFFIVHESESLLTYKTIDSELGKESLDRIYFCCSDGSISNDPSWVLKNFILYILTKRKDLFEKWINIISIRHTKNFNMDSSKVIKIKLPKRTSQNTKINWVGWEKNSSGSFGPQLSRMENIMNPLQLAKVSTNLNLKLMTWRFAPDLDIEKLSCVKCLLIGAGTLGCGVARGLLAWNINNITLIDSGVVRFSNIVRQNLYTYQDALSGTKKKVDTAVQRLREINPNINVEGYDLHIPMPDHPMSENLKNCSNLNTLETLVKQHDVIFLLTDSRESRWLPTLLGTFYQKIVVNAALGFDSYLVMRHGIRRTNQSHKIEKVHGLNVIPGSELGCYFCNDVTAPGDSQKDRTLDQQCTVTRPAVSNIASSIAVELLVEILQHKTGALAPAYVCSKDDLSILLPEGVLGILPHSIRGYLGTYKQILPATERFQQCVACSDLVLKEYEKRGHQFLMDVFKSSKCLETVSGISKILEKMEDYSDFDMPDDSDD